MSDFEQIAFNGMQTLLGKKFIKPGFLYDAVNCNLDSNIGTNCPLYPEIFRNFSSATPDYPGIDIFTTSPELYVTGDVALLIPYATAGFHSYLPSVIESMVLFAKGVTSNFNLYLDGDLSSSSSSRQVLGLALYMYECFGYAYGYVSGGVYYTTALPLTDFYTVVSNIYSDSTPRTTQSAELYAIYQSINPDIYTNTSINPSGLSPTILDVDSHSIDGLFDYTYLNSNQISVSEEIGVVNGTLYKKAIDSPIILKTGLALSKCSFTVYNNILAIFNGQDYPFFYNGSTGIVTQMGAPEASIYQAGALSGTYSYAIGYVDVGGEDVIGTFSNSVSPTLNNVYLELPIGYPGTTGRKIYRNKNGGTTYYLVDTVSDNTTTFYVDNVLDASLTSILPPINNECPKPYFGLSSFGKLVGCVDDIRPSYIYNTDGRSTVFDAAEYLDVSNQYNDNTPLVGVGQDYANVIVGTRKNFYVINYSQSTPALSPTRANVGIKDGYSLVNVPANGDFVGGLLFLSEMNDFRLFNGNFAQPLATSLDNLRTDNISENIKNFVNSSAQFITNCHGAFYDYKYHCVLNNKIFIFDIKKLGWTYYQIQTDTYAPSYNYLAVIRQKLYGGQYGHPIIEKFYSTTKYREESVTGSISTGQLLASNTQKLIDSICIYFEPIENETVDLTVIIDGNTGTAQTYQLNIDGAPFSSIAFSEEYFIADDNAEQFTEVYVNKFAYWVELKIEYSNHFNFRGYKISYKDTGAS